jgi:hypothetical protein
MILSFYAFKILTMATKYGGVSLSLLPSDSLSQNVRFIPYCVAPFTHVSLFQYIPHAKNSETLLANHISKLHA